MKQLIVQIQPLPQVESTLVQLDLSAVLTEFESQAQQQEIELIAVNQISNESGTSLVFFVDDSTTELNLTSTLVDAELITIGTLEDVTPSVFS